jgi:hypothetical protein
MRSLAARFPALARAPHDRRAAAVALAGWFLTALTTAGASSTPPAVPEGGCRTIQMIGSVGNAVSGFATTEDSSALYLLGGEQVEWYWYELDRRGSHYEPVWISPVLVSRPVELLIGDVLPSPGRELVFPPSRRTLPIYSEQTKELLTQFEIGSGAVAFRDFALGDVDGDGWEEILAVDFGDLYVFKPDGTVSWSMADVGYSAVVSGQMDDDPALEIALDTGLVIDAISRQVEHDLGPIGNQLRSVDIDGDGRQELLAARSTSVTEPTVLTVWDVETETVRWSDVLSFLQFEVLDVDGDGSLEVVAAGTTGEQVRVLEASTGLLEATLGPRRSALSGVGVAAFGGEAVPWIVWGEQTSTTATLAAESVLESGGPVRERHTPGRYLAPRRLDVDGDGDLELVVVTTGRLGGGSRVTVREERTLIVELEHSPGLDGLQAIGAFDVARLRPDEAETILVASSDLYYRGRLLGYQVTPQGLIPSWRPDLEPEGQRFSYVEAVDIDGDDQLEVVAMSEVLTTGNDPLVLRMFSADGQLLWESSFVFTARWGAIENVDDDPFPELIAWSGGNIAIVDLRERSVEYRIDARATAISWSSGVGIHAGSLLVGDDRGWVRRFQREGGDFVEVEAFSIPLPFQRTVTGVFEERGNLWVSAYGQLFLRRHDEWIWQSERHDREFGSSLQPMAPPLGRLAVGGNHSLQFLRCAPRLSVRAELAPPVVGREFELIVELSNAGPGRQLDNEGPELSIELPEGLVVRGLSTSLGLLAEERPDLISWNGLVETDEHVDIQVSLTDRQLAAPLVDRDIVVRLQADDDADGVNDPPARDEIVRVRLAEPAPQVPALGRLALGALSLLIGLAGVTVLTRRVP